MNLQEIQDTLKHAMKLRVPPIDPNVHPRERIAAMENYANEVAFHRAEALEALYWLSEAKKPLQDQWDDIDGWEATSRERTKHAEQQAKRRIKPQLYDSLQVCARLQSHLHAQVDRLNRDADWMSREYTFISG